VLWGLCYGAAAVGEDWKVRAERQNIEWSDVTSGDWQGVGATVLLSLHCCESYCLTVTALL